MNSEPQEIPCYTCDKNWLWTPDRPTTLSKPTQCPACEAEEERSKLEKKRQKLAQSLIVETPPRYQATDIDHPKFNRKLWEAVKGWRPDAETPWLGLVSPSGKSKTRTAFLLLRDIVLEDFDRRETPADMRRTMSFQCAESYAISKCVVGQYDNDYEVKNSAKQFLKRIRRTDILLLDDFGKAKNTPAFAAEMFAILDHRHAYNLPTIWTANSTPEDIVADMSPDMAGPLAGRLIDCSTIISIK